MRKTCGVIQVLAALAIFITSFFITENETLKIILSILTGLLFGSGLYDLKK